MYAISLLSKLSPRTVKKYPHQEKIKKEIPTPRENYPVPDPTHLMDPGPDRPLN